MELEQKHREDILMASKDTNNCQTRRPPAITLEDREDELINLALDQAEERIRSGKASDSLLIQFIRHSSAKAQLEKQKLEADVELAKAKAESIRQSERAEETYLKAIEALKRYSGQGEDEDYD